MWVPAVANLLLLSLGLLEAIQDAELDMALDSFDDEYVGCEAAMTAALPHLQLMEFRANKVYADGWAEASRKWRELQDQCPARLPALPEGFQDKHGMALLAYTNNSLLYREFNAAVRQAGHSRAHYLQHFSFKTLHFLLIEALQLLRKEQRQSGCYQVFRGVKGLRFRTSGPGATVRLAGFASSSLSKKVAQKFGEDTFFSIWTCHGALIQNYSASPWQEEVLIPPFETFRVITARTLPNGHVHIELKAQDKHSKYNCEYIKASAQERLSTAWSLLLLLTFLAVGPFPGSPGLF
ncbi:GPI-linked NAD(P)(+)--arginine ADP-ribosyltransferase 1-like [Oryctolagus cuniculus]|uniref:GPI-linked NAD(P)(+)--arginine ADP-ribosyltransferase 1-like n=1 Tax=Oryctolagus cuniculus TaxID=9986 RepID=UPI00222F0B22|nr:GPI-linked NAD(P)(+)--arginine ADP-ribosyltransferase 1-like [Oryctolagus cuniculus]